MFLVYKKLYLWAGVAPAVDLKVSRLVKEAEIWRGKVL